MSNINELAVQHLLEIEGIVKDLSASPAERILLIDGHVKAFFGDVQFSICAEEAVFESKCPSDPSREELLEVQSHLVASLGKWKGEEKANADAAKDLRVHSVETNEVEPKITPSECAAKWDGAAIKEKSDAEPIAEQTSFSANIEPLVDFMDEAIGKALDLMAENRLTAAAIEKDLKRLQGNKDLDADFNGDRPGTIIGAFKKYLEEAAGIKKNLLYETLGNSQTFQTGLCLSKTSNYTNTYKESYEKVGQMLRYAHEQVIAEFLFAYLKEKA